MSEELVEERSFEDVAKDLGYDLNKVKTKEEEKEAPKERTPLEKFMERFKNHPQCPTQAQLDRWKRDHIGVYVFNAELNGETYLFRPMNRLEWKQLQETAASMNNNDMFQELVVTRCVLWPGQMSSMIPSSRAGLVNTLFSAIMACSYFMSEEAVLNFVEKL